MIKTDITIEPGTKSHRIILRINGRTSSHYISADIPVEKTQAWAESAYDRAKAKSDKELAHR